MTVVPGVKPQEFKFFARTIPMDPDWTITVELYLGDDASAPLLFRKHMEREGHNFVDIAFMAWTRGSEFTDTVQDSALIDALITYAVEHASRIPWHRLTFRFLPNQDQRLCSGGGSEQHWVLTTDKSNLPDRYKRMLELGDDVVLAEEEAEKKKRRDAEVAEAKRKEECRVMHRKVIMRVVNALRDLKVPDDADLKILIDAKLFESTAPKRAETHFPGEREIMWYEFVVNGVKHAGYIGLNKDKKVLVLDERYPQYRTFYKGKEELEE